MVEYSCVGGVKLSRVVMVEYRCDGGVKLSWDVIIEYSYNRAD